MLDVKFNNYDADKMNEFCKDVIDAIHDYYNDYILDLDIIDEEVNGILDFKDIFNKENTDIGLFLTDDLCGDKKIYFRFKYSNIIHYYSLYSPEIGSIYDKHYCKRLYDAICKYIINKEVI